MHGRMDALVELKPGAPLLSSREVEVLRWAAKGKTSAETGMILGISERTVNFHIARAIEKCGACNKISAVAQAVLRGLL